MKTMEEMRKNELRSDWKKGHVKLSFLAKDAVIDQFSDLTRKAALLRPSQARECRVDLL